MGGEWQYMPFTEAVRVNPRITLKRGEAYPFVDMQSLDPSKPTVAPSRSREFTGGGSKFEAYDTLMARITPCLENGKIARYVPDDERLGLAFGSTEFIVIRGREGTTDNDFAFYLTRWSEFRSFAIAQMSGSSGRQRVPPESLSGFEVPVPPLPEQRAIAHILGTLDDKIELNRRMNETLEAMAQAIFKSWFVDFDPVVVNALRAGNPIPEKFAAKAAHYRDNPGALRLPEDILCLFPNRFQDSELGPIPEGWGVNPLPELIEVNPRRSLRKGEVAPYLAMAHMPTRGHIPDRVIERPFGSGTRFMNGDTLVARITPCLENGKTAYVDFLQEGQVGWGSTEYIVLRPKAPLPEEFAYCLARSEAFREFALQSMTGSSGRQRVPAESLFHYPLISPTEQVANCFGTLVRPLFVRVNAAARESGTLSSLRDTLLPKLISGGLRVPDAEKILENAL